jgi:hypothetical protein
MEERQMTTYYVFANGEFWGAWKAESEADACLAAAKEVGTEGNADGLEAYEAGTDPSVDAEVAAHL